MMLSHFRRGNLNRRFPTEPLKVWNKIKVRTLNFSKRSATQKKIKKPLQYINNSRDPL